MIHVIEYESLSHPKVYFTIDTEDNGRSSYCNTLIKAIKGFSAYGFEVWDNYMTRDVSSHTIISSHNSKEDLEDYYVEYLI